MLKETGVYKRLKIPQVSGNFRTCHTQLITQLPSVDSKAAAGVHHFNDDDNNTNNNTNNSNNNNNNNNNNNDSIDI